ncbi:MAG: molybdate ABC transporter permease subunit [Thermoanaerobaculia bacterium]
MLVMIPPGLAIAWLLARYRWFGKSLVETAVALPLVMPPVATGLLLLRLLGRRGPLGGELEAIGLPIVFTWRAVVVAMAVMALPLFVRSARSAFENVPPRLEQVARTLGARRLRVAWTITLPLARRGLVGGLLLAFARALGEFGATILVAGNIPGRTTTLATAIYQHVQLGEDGAASKLLLISVLLSFVALAASEWLVRSSKASPGRSAGPVA